MGFTHVQGAVGSGVSTASITITLPSNPVQGNIVCVGMAPGIAISGLTVVDGNSNSYTITPNSPSTFQTNCGQVWLAYLLNAPANANKVITLSWNTADNTPVAWADEFSVSGGTAAFDKDAKANTGTAGTTINTPTITPTGPTELLFACAASGSAITAPAANGNLGVWKGSGGAITSGDMAEYDLSASSLTAVNFTQASAGWSAMAMAFTFTSLSGTFEDDSFSIVPCVGFDQNVSVW
jgi:hypothetical protein